MRKSSVLLTPIIALAAACGQAPEPERTDEPAGEAGTTSEIHQGYSETAPLYEVDGFVISNDDVEAYLWNPRGKTDEQIADRAQFLTDAYEVKRTDAQLARAAEAREKYSDAIVINSLP